MSEEALNTAIAAKWESAGLDASHDDSEIPDGGDEDDVVEVDPDADTTPDADTDTAEDTGTDDTTETTTTDDETETETATKEAAVETETKTDKEEAQHDAEDELAKALGLGKPPEDPKKRAQWWKTRVPYSQLHKVVVEREKKLNESHSGVLKERDGRITEYDTRFEGVKQVEDIITNHPEQYVQTLAALLPDTYGKLFAPILGGSKDAAAQKLPDATDPGPMPEPDLKLADGALTYSLEGLQKRMEWEQKVTEQKMLGRFKPHLDFLQQQQDAAVKRQKQEAADQHVKLSAEAANKALEEVKTWDLGEENLDAILAEASKLNASYNAETALNIAYRKIVVPKLKANRDLMHAEIMKGLKKTSAKQTAAGLTQSRTTATTPVDPSTVDLDTRIKNAWKRKGLI